MLGELSGIAKATQSGFQLLGAVGQWFAARRARTRSIRDVKELLGVAKSELYSYRVSMQHPLYRQGDPHPDDLLAFASIAGAEIGMAQDSVH